jgi:hypothetical protein
VKRFWRAVICGIALMTATSAGASTFEAAVGGAGGSQVLNSPVPVALTNSVDFNIATGGMAGNGAGGPGLANSSTEIVLGMPDPMPPFFSATEYITAEGRFYLDGIFVNGPDGTPPGTLFNYSINIAVTGRFAASSGMESDISSASGRVRWGTNNTGFGGIGNVELGSVQVNSNGEYIPTGIFTNSPDPGNHQVGGTTTMWSGRTGYETSVSILVDATVFASGGSPGGHMQAEADVAAVLTGVSPVFNLPPGYTADSADGMIVGNRARPLRDEVGDAGNRFNPQVVEGPFHTHFTGLLGHLGDGDTSDAYSFFFEGGDFFVRTALQINGSTIKPLLIKLYADDQTLLTPDYSNVLTGVVGWDLAPGDYVIEQFWEGADPPVISSFFAENPDLTDNPYRAAVSSPQAIPEPATVVLGISLICLCGRTRRRT